MPSNLKKWVVSVCIPTYNGQEYLRVCLDSVLSQTYPDFEVLVVDDCSTDNTVRIIQEYADRDPRVHLIHNNRNLGLVGNWNRCIELAQGEWIKFVFQDDMLRKDCLEKMLALATRPIIFCCRKFLFEDGTDSETIRVYNTLPCIPDLLDETTDVHPERVRTAVLQESRNFFGEPTAALLHYSLFERFGLFNVDLAQFCDLEYWIRVSINTGFAYATEPLVTFRYHSTSTTANNRDPLNDERVSIFDQLVMLHEFAYNPHYSSLSEQAIAATPKRNFKRELIEKAVWVHARARALTNLPAMSDNSWIKQWDKLMEHYPRLGYTTWHSPYRMKALWMRHIGWRFTR